LCPAFRKGSRERGFGFRVAHPLTRKDRHCGNAPGEKIVASTLDAKYRALLYITPGNSLAVIGRISRPASVRRSSHASAGLVAPALT
jgi:hypothetical protein